VAQFAIDREKPLTVMPSLRRAQDDRHVMLKTLGTPYAQGRRVDWAGMYCASTCPSVAPRHRRLLRALIRICGSVKGLIR
jgi:acyl transferase domain-containing protein